MSGWSVRGAVSLAIGALGVVALASGCNDLVGVDFGSMHAAAQGTDDGGDADGGGGADGTACIPKTCAALGATCGTQNDGCGNALQCGTCDGGSCVSGKCACTPTTCPALGVQCGTHDDGCGGALDCGNCTQANYACVMGKCACQPKTCKDQGAECGKVSDGCGSTYDCGNCPTDGGASVCGGGGPNKCGAQPCMPKTSCPANSCGAISDGCGGILQCGSCTAPQTCGGAGTPNQCGCTPTTCQAQGKNCGTIPDGCGGTLSCGSCTSPDTCAGGGTPNVCGCTPVTSCPSGDQCGTVPDGCGNQVSCGTCTAPDTCNATTHVCVCTPYCPSCCGGQSDGCGGTCPDKLCCGGGGGGCFVAGSLVAMADGSFEPIERVRVGELVRSFDGSTETTARVIATRAHGIDSSADGIVVINGTLRSTTEHPIWAHGERVRADALRVGDVIEALSPGGTGGLHPDVVRSLELLPGGMPTYELVVDGPGTYVVDGVVLYIKP